MVNIIETHELTKFYGKARGIQNVNLCVGEGEIFGFIGPNGAGKSTTIRTLLALIKKTSGEAKIFGLDCERDRVKILARVGYLPGEVFYYDRMRARDLLSYSASFYGKDCSSKIKELSGELELDLDKRIEDMSLGNRKKVGIVQGLLHSPELIILDEPTSGLDPLMQKTFFDIIKRERDRGAAVLFSSHILGEVQRLCDRVAVIKEGRIIETKSVAELRRGTYKRVSLTLADGEALPPSFLSGGAVNITTEGKTVSFMYGGEVGALLSALSGLRLEDADISEPPLEDIFMHYYTDGGEGK